MMFFKNELAGVLFAKNYSGLLHFYEELLGLRRVNSWEAGEGMPRGVKLAVAGGGFLVILDKPADLGPTSFWMEARDINGLYAVLRRTPGTDIFEDIADMYFHARSFQVRDPDGNASFIVAYEKDVKPYTADAEKGKYFKDEFRAVLFVEDLNACYKFYTEVLEIPCVYSWNEGPGDRGFKYKAAGSGAYIETLHRVPLSPQRTGAIAIEAGDLELCHRSLREKTTVGEIGELKEHSGFGVRYFDLKDPNKNIVYVFSYKGGA
jgi:catechol 2,3-dioxygenase-like lactoylglutathione lyase family enzyme